ncbi:hypothetical protein [Ohessyouella blattaphilus]|uniref:Uncharacterized protein n=1 Tax=Ohessyouella blattaphilus TaxID=2949333 RepID=A0ABT1EDB2_9FIRM|nr:hypothetical protein [Ohessyouella blattaphilus]MCP1108690.1 hypothetical protein [Ohessyouella blattaphilus]MCR8562084.1 hypothetical protein [Ohessyouella blattaphilus]
MIDKRKVQLLTKLSMYEKNEGKEDIKVSDYYRKDYISYNVIAQLLWMTLAYVMIWALVALIILQGSKENLDLTLMIILGLLALGGYLILLLVYGIGSYQFYSKKHARARHRVKQYNNGLIRLLRIYERENKGNGKRTEN